MRSCTMQVRLQRPTISAEMSFLLAVMKFYIPDFAIASVTPIPFQTQDVLLSGQPDYFDRRKMPPCRYACLTLLTPSILVATHYDIITASGVFPCAQHLKRASAGSCRLAHCWCCVVGGDGNRTPWKL